MTYEDIIVLETGKFVAGEYIKRGQACQYTEKRKGKWGAAQISEAVLVQAATTVSGWD